MLTSEININILGKDFPAEIDYERHPAEETTRHYEGHDEWIDILAVRVWSYQAHAYITIPSLEELLNHDLYPQIFNQIKET